MKRAIKRYVPEVRQYVPLDNIYLSGAEVTDFRTINKFIIATIEECLKFLKNEKMDGGPLKCSIVENPKLSCIEVVFEFEQREGDQ